MPLAPESKETRAEGAGTVIRDTVAEVIIETAIEDPGLGLGLVLGSITLVVVIVWTIIKSFFELMGGPPQNLFG
jgi:hypothetical protein